MSKPSGIGVYIRDIKREIHGTPVEAAEKARGHGVSWVAIEAAWCEPTGRSIRFNTYDMAPYARAFKEFGIDVWIWGYPSAGQEAQFMAYMSGADQDAMPEGWILDPELGYRRAETPTPAQYAGELLERSLRVGRSIGVTSYRIPPRDFPRELFLRSADWVSPQIYRGADVDATESREFYSRRNDVVIPSLPAFGTRGNSDAMIPWWREVDRPRTAIYWSWRSLNVGSRWRVLSAIADLAARKC